MLTYDTAGLVLLAYDTSGPAGPRVVLFTASRCSHSLSCCLYWASHIMSRYEQLMQVVMALLPNHWPGHDLDTDWHKGMALATLWLGSVKGLPSFHPNCLLFTLIYGQQTSLCNAALHSPPKPRSSPLFVLLCNCMARNCCKFNFYSKES